MDLMESTNIGTSLPFLVKQGTTAPDSEKTEQSFADYLKEEPVVGELLDNVFAYHIPALPETPLPEDAIITDEAEIAKLSLVVVHNPKTGETIELTGKEYLDMTKKLGVEPILTVSYNNDDLQPVSADAELPFDKFVEAVELKDNPVLTRQAEKIAEVLNTDTKIKVSVNNKDTYVRDIKSPMINLEEPEPVDEVLLEEDEVVAVEAEAPAPQVQSVEVSEAEVSADAPELFTPVAAAEVSVPKADNTTTDKTSFRDVYKGMSHEVVEQVKVNITKSAVKGVDKIDIELKPDGLGKVEVNLHINKDGKLQANITSTRIDSLEALQKDAASLEKALNNAGFNTEEGSLSFSLKEDRSGQKEQDDLRGFMSKALEIQEEQTNIVQEVWDGKSALNIRV